jgi:hypothetical protein
LATARPPKERLFTAANIPDFVPMG